MPAPYQNLLYSDLSDTAETKISRLNRASLPTVYADIDYLKTDAMKPKLPEENVDQTT